MPASINTVIFSYSDTMSMHMFCTQALQVILYMCIMWHAYNYVFVVWYRINLNKNEQQWESSDQWSTMRKQCWQIHLCLQIVCLIVLCVNYVCLFIQHKLVCSSAEAHNKKECLMLNIYWSADVYTDGLVEVTTTWVCVVCSNKNLPQTLKGLTYKSDMQHACIAN